MSDSPPWPAPAKINRFLHIVGRRADGYHDLQTLFQFLDYGDDLHFRVHDRGTVHRSGGLPNLREEDDLAVRAALLLQQVTGTHLGVDMHIDKRIPAGGGLGGGSSDAATTLVALNALWRTALPTPALAELALQLGSDVPVFVSGRASFAEQRGDRLSSAAPDEPWFLVVDPGVTVSSARMYADARLQRDCASVTLDDFAAGRCGNVFEPLVLADHEPVREAHAWLSNYASVHLSGTGGCLFAAFPTRADARQVLAKLPEDWTGIVARGSNVSPLHVRLQRHGD
ncbi:MAG: 4-(cytidine 5'-diphospho)-2-C-methyl-D-erythritol kinase [Gammaproteobacteria bacterium]|nr:4-(cytidine 5'-diphospho)-2-C-methyl-D-erythritol kinase [Gammaproteobacteria bacterium]